MDANADIPYWVGLAAFTAIGLGTMSGGWRIVKTIKSKITKLKPVGGFCKETGGAGGRIPGYSLRRPGFDNSHDHQLYSRGRHDAPAIGRPMGVAGRIFVGL